MKAVWNGAVIAESDTTEVVEGNTHTDASQRSDRADCISGITELSPSLSAADGRLVFSAYEDTVIAILHSPREKLLGIINEINPSGIAIRSIELGYFDDWCRSIVA